jgi:PAS domain S-box-containing protein
MQEQDLKPGIQLGIADEHALLVAIADSSPDAIVSIGLDGTILSWNAASERLYGYRADEIVGERVRILVPPARRPELAGLAERIRRGERIERLETRRLRKDGSEVDVLVTLSPIRGASGEVIGILGLVHGVGEQKAMEATLREREEQYRDVFASTSDGLVITDLDGNLVDANPAFCRMHGYTRDEMLRLDPTEFIAAESQHLFREYVEAARQGHTYECRALDIRKDGTRFHIGVHGSLFTYRGQPHTLGVIRDITQQVEAEALLERQVAERTRELSMLLEVARTAASTLELGPLLGLILDQLKAVIDYTGSAVGVFEGSDLRLLDSRGPDGRETMIVGMRLPVLPGAEAIWERIQRREPVLCADVRGETEIARGWRAALADQIELPPFRYVRSWLALPLVVHDRVIGLLSLSRDEPGSYSEDHARLVLAIANQIAVALENARLFEEAQEETRRTAALAEIGASVALAGSLETILDGLADSVVKATGAIASALLLIEGEPPTERIVGSYGLPQGSSAAYSLATQRGARSISLHALQKGLPLILRDARQVVLSDRAWEPIHALVRDAAWDTYVTVPLVARNRKLGTLGIFYAPGEKPTDDDLTFLSAVADQAAIAVDNARLFAEVQGKATLEERQRLARELHDSVSQALYGIALGARTARSLAERDPTRLAEPLDYVVSLAEAGLAEMRALIFELRPESLATEGLVAALGRQATLLQVRHGIVIETTLSDEPAVSLECKEVLYRIAQEAIQNIVKHARAGRVTLRLDGEHGHLRLEIKDDGAGFDTQGEFPGHLGLRSMRERAMQIGGSLEIESASGAGTRVQARVPAFVGTPSATAGPT